LSDANLQPDWVAGISIGAVNAALIAGNVPEKRVERLREFWEAEAHRRYDQHLRHSIRQSQHLGCDREHPSESVRTRLSRVTAHRSSV
jgi:predicted acylesterase/phospholipase RssA